MVAFFFIRIFLAEAAFGWKEQNLMVLWRVAKLCIQPARIEIRKILKSLLERRHYPCASYMLQP